MPYPNEHAYRLNSPDKNEDIEKRIFEFRIDMKSESPHELIGHAAIFDQYANILWWQERIMPGAFTKTIKKDDVRALFNHDPNFVLGRNKNGTLELKEDDKGLFVRIDYPKTQLIKDLVISPIERGDISQMSFAFQILEDEWTDEKKVNKRDIKLVKLFDVSPVTYPAYKDTNISLRSLKAYTEFSERPSNKAWRAKLLLKQQQLNLKKRRYFDE